MNSNGTESSEQRLKEQIVHVLKKGPMTELDIRGVLGHPSGMGIALNELLDERQIDNFGRLAGKRKLVTLYYLVNPRKDADLDLTTNVAVGPPAKDFEVESESGARHIRLPPWFRIDRRNVQSLEDLIEWPKGRDRQTTSTYFETKERVDQPHIVRRHWRIDQTRFPM